MLEAIAQEEDIPASFLGKIFQSLAKAGLVKSARGSGGGFALLKPAAEITVLEVIEAIEGKIAFQRCLEEKPSCTHMAGCGLCGLFSEAQDRVKEVFNRTTIASLALKHTPFAAQRPVRGLTSSKRQLAKPTPAKPVKLSRSPQPI